MISTYHRPQTLEQALALISRTNPRTLPLGGGTYLSHSSHEIYEVVDLQNLGINKIKLTGNYLEIGATVTLENLVDNKDFPINLRSAIKLEAPFNIRNAASVAGTIAISDGRSSFNSAMLALDAKILIQPGDQDFQIGNLLPLRESLLQRRLIIKIVIPININIAFEYVARTPVDKPIVSVTVAQWPSGRTRIALSGYGKIPLLAMDGSESTGFEAALQNVFSDARDERGTAEYRQEVAIILAKRCLTKIELNKKQV
jgi:CO/xanthine dehydrogenase FAD-binding subunit